MTSLDIHVHDFQYNQYTDNSWCQGELQGEIWNSLPWENLRYPYPVCKIESFCWYHVHKPVKLYIYKYAQKKFTADQLYLFCKCSGTIFCLLILNVYMSNTEMTATS